ncbi:tyrosine-type recombinase/integrase [Aromatoleum evansii]|uniref:tyrosine-type recombinase/integrase n=1 Tax=Aromatoleum evansii TaxID=59406 RepID=UPI001B7CF3A9|nr:tyrosine-type recombinase/integrase [Aromatoleum evansii]
MRAKKGKRGHVWYYLDKGRQPDGSRPWIPLGSSFPDALRAYAEQVETVNVPPLTVPDLLNDWNTKTAATRKSGTLEDIRYSLPSLIRFFGDPPAPLDGVEPVHIRQYLDWRVAEAKKTKGKNNAKRVEEGKRPLAIKPNEGAVRANREIAWFSAAWNWARDRGITKAPNPVIGVKRHKEAGRDIYVEDDELNAILEHADEPLREAIELAYLIGQRPGDLRDIKETDIRDGCIVLEQEKTDAKLRIEVTGALAQLIARIKARKAKIEGVRSLALICNEQGQPLKKAAMRYRFDKAREAAASANKNKAQAERLRSIQFRDLRAKAASDMEALDKAQKLLGHTKREMTEHYVRKRRGEKVSPVK